MAKNILNPDLRIIWRGLPRKIEFKKITALKFICYNIVQFIF